MPHRISREPLKVPQLAESSRGHQTLWTADGTSSSFWGDDRQKQPFCNPACSPTLRCPNSPPHQMVLQRGSLNNAGRGVCEPAWRGWNHWQTALSINTDYKRCKWAASFFLYGTYHLLIYTLFFLFIVCLLPLEYKLYERELSVLFTAEFSAS